MADTDLTKEAVAKDETPKTYPITGIQSRDTHGRPFVRKDIDEWYIDQADSSVSNGIQLTLFVRALEIIQKRDVDDERSYFRLAGIHSAPWCAWDGEANPEVPSGEARIKGFCVHNNYTFPTWHRVYMLLYEQALYEAMLEFIETPGNVPDNPSGLKDLWKKEASQWRLPYWDFARVANRPVGTFSNKGDSDDDKLRLPILCMMPTVKTIVYKDLNKDYENRPNPMYKYVTQKPMGDFGDYYKIVGERIKGKTSEFIYPWDKCTATTKYGILDGYYKDIWSDAGQNWLRANYALNEHSWYDKDWVGSQKPVPTLQDMVFRLFQYGLDSWGAFATTRYDKDEEEEKDKEYTSTPQQGNAKNAMSLEFIHNNVHNWVGGTQFVRPEKENIHLWGAGHMSSVHMAAFDPIFFIYHCNIDRLTAIWQWLNPDAWFNDKFSQKAKDNDLIPFHKDDRKELYKSDDVRCWRDLHYEYEILQQDECGKEKKRTDVLKEIETLYGDPTKELYNGLPGSERLNDDYIITVVYNKFALDGASYKINLFLGDVPKDSYSGPLSKNFVASIYNFSGSLNMSGCSNCHQQKGEGVESIAQVPATVPVRNFLANVKNGGEVPEPAYVVLNSLGEPVGVDVQVKLYRSQREFYKHRWNANPRDPLRYELVKRGRQADGIV